MTLDKERLRVLAEAATPGPWILLPIEEGSPYLRIRGTRLGTRYKVANVLAPTYFMPRDGIESTANAEFIAAAREAIPALLSENAALEKGEQQALQAASVEAKLFDEERQKNAALAAEVERTSNNRDMWKAQCAVQAQEFERLRKDEREACALVCDAQAETHELLSNTQAVKGCDDCANAIRARGRNVP